MATATQSAQNNLLSPTYIPKTSLQKDTRPTSSTSSTHSRRTSETPEWLLPDYRPTEFRSRSSSVNNRSRSISGSWDTHKVSAKERKWRQDQEAKSRRRLGKLMGYGFMEGK